MARGAGAAEGGARVAGTRTRPRGSPGQHARLWASKRCLSQLVSVSSPAASLNTECPINNLEKRQVPTPCTNTHTHVITHTHGRSQVPSFEITHTHTEKGEAGRGDAEERPKYDKERRGRGGIEPPREADHCQPKITRKSRRERERERGSMRASGRASAVARRLFLFYHRPRRRIRNLRSPLSQIKTIKEPQLSLYCEGKRCIEFLPS